MSTVFHCVRSTVFSISLFLTLTLTRTECSVVTVGTMGFIRWQGGGRLACIKGLLQLLHLKDTVLEDLAQPGGPLEQKEG